MNTYTFKMNLFKKQVVFAVYTNDANINKILLNDDKI